MTAGRPRLEPVKCSGAAKAKRRRHHRQARFAPCPEICYSAPKICSWQPRCQFFPAGGRMNLRRRLQPLVLSRAGLQSERAQGGLPDQTPTMLAGALAQISHVVAEHGCAYEDCDQEMLLVRATTKPTVDAPAQRRRRLASRPARSCPLRSRAEAIAGGAYGLRSPVLPAWETLFADVTLAAGCRVGRARAGAPVSVPVPLFWDGSECSHGWIPVTAWCHEFLRHIRMLAAARSSRPPAISG